MVNGISRVFDRPPFPATIFSQKFENGVSLASFAFAISGESPSVSSVCLTSSRRSAAVPPSFCTQSVTSPFGSFERVMTLTDRAMPLRIEFTVAPCCWPTGSLSQMTTTSFPANQWFWSLSHLFDPPPELLVATMPNDRRVSQSFSPSTT